MIGWSSPAATSEALRDALRLVQKREADDEARLAALRDAANAGINAGRYRSFAGVEALRSHFADRADQVLNQSAE